MAVTKLLKFAKPQNSFRVGARLQTSYFIRRKADSGSG